MPRFKITIEYDGSGFVGWQRQINGISVQEAIENAAKSYCQQKTTVHGSGRTDSGVHAIAQVAHLDLPRVDENTKVRAALNAYLRDLPISILDAEKVRDDFHARFDAIERVYLYRILSRRAPVALERHRVWWLPRFINSEAMSSASKILIGNHDFSSFRSSSCQSRSPVKTLKKIEINKIGDTVEILVTARSFLHHQVRNIVGTLSLVGEGKWSEVDLRNALLSKRRSCGGPTAPPHGLYLKSVIYPKDIY